MKEYYFEIQSLKTKRLELIGIHSNQMNSFCQIPIVHPVNVEKQIYNIGKWIEFYEKMQED